MRQSTFLLDIFNCVLISSAVIFIDFLFVIVLSTTSYIEGKPHHKLDLKKKLKTICYPSSSFP